jgi:hypothetical protein
MGLAARPSDADVEDSSSHSPASGCHRPDRGVRGLSDYRVTRGLDALNGTSELRYSTNAGKSESGAQHFFRYLACTIARQGRKALDPLGNLETGSYEYL